VDGTESQEALAANRAGAAVSASRSRDHRPSDNGVDLLNRNGSLNRRLSSRRSGSLGVGVGVDGSQRKEGKRALDLVGRHFEIEGYVNKILDYRFIRMKMS